jgi:hypothetical protein
MKVEQLVDDTQVAAVLAAVNMVGAEEAPPEVPQGELGGCVACGHTVASHFTEGRFVGCLKGTRDTVFVLMPITRREVKGKQGGKTNGAITSHDRGPSVREVNAAKPTEPAIVARGFVRARYFSTLHHKANPEKLPLSETRLKVLKALQASGKRGLRAKQIMRKAGLPHGSVQQTLNWLRHHKVEGRLLVAAKEDANSGIPEFSKRQQRKS